MMSSETSSKPRRKGSPAPSSTRAGARQARAGDRATIARQSAADAPAALNLRPAHLLILGTVAAASAAALMAHGTRPANIVFVVLAVIAAGIVAVAVFRTLWPLASDQASKQPEMVGGRTRAALEREKTIVLRAIKELEFDRAMGKVSAADCEDMIGRLRARAVRLLRQLDAGSAGYRELIDRELNARLASGGSGRRVGYGREASPAREAGARQQPQAAAGNGVGDVAAERAAERGDAPPRDHGAELLQNWCLACGSANDADARFCKACGTKLGAPA
jgi:hypothetical protein